MPSTLRRDPRKGREWYAPERQPIPRLATLTELVARAYGDEGPKAGVRPRRDTIETLVAGYRYLHVRAGRDGSGDFATTAGQTIDGLMHELSRRSAKRWDPRVGAGLEGRARQQRRIRKYGSAVVKMLDELAGCGLLVWGGERDNNGLWWRLRIRLLDPDGPPVERAAWMRPSPRLTEPPEGHPDRGLGGGEGDSAESAGAAADPENAPGLVALYDRLEQLGVGRPELSPALERRIVAAAARFRAHAEHRPAGVPEDPWAVLGAQIEQFTIDQDGHPLVRALPLLDALARRMQTAAKNSSPSATGVPDSRNCAALYEPATARTTTPTRLPSALASKTGAHPSEKDDANNTTSGDLNPAEKGGWVGAEVEAPDPFEGIAERVAAHERRWEALTAPARARDGDTVQRARSWSADAPAPVGLLCAAVAVVCEGRRPWLGEEQVQRLRRAERRYALYAAQRPPAAPTNPAAVLLALAEQRPPGVRQPLAWAIAQLDLLSKRMRRQAKHPAVPGHLEAARKRAGRRGERRVRDREQAASTSWRRPNDRRDSEVDEAVQRVAQRVIGHRLRRPPAWTIARLSERLWERGVLETPERLRCRLRDELLTLEAPPDLLADIAGPAPSLVTFDASRAQLSAQDRERLERRPWLKRRRARDREARADPMPVIAAEPTVWIGDDHAEALHPREGRQAAPPRRCPPSPIIPGG